MPRNPSGFKISFFPIKNVFPINWQILKNTGNGIWQAFCKFPIDLKLGLLNVGLMLYFQDFPNSQRDLKMEFFNLVLAGLSQFMKEMENWDFWILV